MHQISRWLPLIGFVIVLFFLAFLLPQKHETGASKLSLKILCYNIHHAAPPSVTDSIDLDAIGRVITDHQPDLVALQEVDVFTRRSGPFNQAEELGKKTGLTPYFIKAIDHDGGEYGVAILSRYPMSETNRYPLPTKEGSGGEPRVLGTATLSLPGQQKIIFACTHLDAQQDSVNRHLQINAIVKTLKDSTFPVIIAGDFNAAPGSETIRVLDTYFKRTCSPCDFTIPVDHPKEAIDFIAFSPAGKFKVKKHAVIPERYASDHLPVLAVLEMSY